MEIKYIKEFIYVVETGSFASAAKLCYLNKSQISRHISSLEEELACKLCNRYANHITLTDEGTLFYSEVKKLAEQFTRLNEHISPASGPDRIRSDLVISVYCEDNFDYILMDSSYDQNFKTIKLHDHNFVDRLNDCSIDIALEIYEPENITPNIGSVVLNSLKSDIVFSSSLSNADIEKIRSGKSEITVFIPPKSVLASTDGLINYLLSSCNLKRDSFMELNDFNELINMITSNGGVTIVPHSHSDIFFNLPDLKTSSFCSAELRAYWNTDLRNPHVSNLISELKRNCDISAGRIKSIAEL